MINIARIEKAANAENAEEIEALNFSKEEIQNFIKRLNHLEKNFQKRTQIESEEFGLLVNGLVSIIGPDWETGKMID